MKTSKEVAEVLRNDSKEQIVNRLFGTVGMALMLNQIAEGLIEKIMRRGPQSIPPEGYLFVLNSLRIITAAMMELRTVTPQDHALAERMTRAGKVFCSVPGCKCAVVVERAYTEFAQILNEAVQISRSPQAQALGNEFTRILEGVAKENESDQDEVTAAQFTVPGSKAKINTH